MTYKVVIIPPEMRTLLPSTVDLLSRFLSAGGRVIAFYPLPEWIGAQPDASLSELWKKPGMIVLDSTAALNGTLETLLARRVSILTRHGQQAAHLLYMQRKFDGKLAYFIVNNDREHNYRVDLQLEGSGRLEEWDALTGEIRPIAAKWVGGAFNFTADFGSAGSRLYLVDPNKEMVVEAMQKFVDSEKNFSRPLQPVSYIGPSCAFTRSDPNILTLDMCSYRFEGRTWSEVTEVWRAQDAIRNELGMRPNYYNGLPQRYRWALQVHPRDGALVELRFPFVVKQIPQKPVFLLVEGAQNFKIQLNGQAVSNTPAGWYLDQAFHKVELPEARPGHNEIVLQCAYTNYLELEDCFLLGDFGVSLEREIISEPARLQMGDWTSQGYPHYAGSMIYHGTFTYQPGKKICLFLGEYQAVDVAIWVNQKLVGHIPWASRNGLDITAAVQPGANQVDIEVVGSPRNMLGPLHRAPDHEMWTDWRSFRRTNSSFTPDYVLWGWGLKTQVRLVEEV